MDTRKTANALGWFSIGLGVTELLFAGGLSRFLGVSRGHGLIRSFGAREIATGTALLGTRNKSPWLWARVAGDALDLAALGVGYSRSRKPSRIVAMMAGIAAITALDALTARTAR